MWFRCEHEYSEAPALSIRGNKATVKAMERRDRLTTLKRNL
jgi:hypothetical protein